MAVARPIRVGFIILAFFLAGSFIYVSSNSRLPTVYNPLRSSSDVAIDVPAAAEVGKVGEAIEVIPPDVVKPVMNEEHVPPHNDEFKDAVEPEKTDAEKEKDRWDDTTGTPEKTEEKPAAQSPSEEKSPAKTPVDTSKDITPISKSPVKIPNPFVAHKAPDVTIENAALVMLVRNEELHAARYAMRQVEDRFNRRYGYPWVFLNDVPFTEEFKTMTSGIASGAAHYAQIPKEHWSMPQWIDESEARKRMKKMGEEGIIYGESESYRHMCRFNSGFFYRQEVMQQFRYYWRVEPFVEYYCDVVEDPFRFLAVHNKTYTFTMALYEYEATIPTLWEAVREFAKKHPEYIHPDSAIQFLTDAPGAGLSGPYNLCHFWSNFEIADLEFFRGEAYQAFFSFLDRRGGFFYERWGDAPIHSIAAALFLPRSAIHFYDSIGYRHAPYTHCPQDRESHDSGRCSCEPSSTFDYDGYGCLARWLKVAEVEYPAWPGLAKSPTVEMIRDKGL
ncbi:hypothetical protein YB2330_001052 [Saitoella coloradoensis]